MLIVAARNKDGLRFQSVKTCGRAAGTRAYRVVYIGDAVFYAHLLQTMLNTGKLLCDPDAGLIRDEPISRSKGCHVVFKIVRAGELNVIGAHELRPSTVVNLIDYAVLAVNTVFRHFCSAEV